MKRPLITIIDAISKTGRQAAVLMLSSGRARLCGFLLAMLIVAGGCASFPETTDDVMVSQYVDMQGRTVRAAEWQDESGSYTIRITDPEESDERRVPRREGEQWREPGRRAEPQPADARKDMALTEPPDYKETTHLLQQMGASRNPERARPLAQAIITKLRPHTVSESGNPIWHYHFGAALAFVYFDLLQSRDPAHGSVDAEEVLSNAIYHLEKVRELTAADKGTDGYADLHSTSSSLLAGIYEARGSHFWQRKDMGLARENYGLGVKVLHEQHALHDKPGEMNPFLVALELKYADACWHLGNVSEAADIYDSRYTSITNALHNGLREIQPAAAGLAAAYMVTGTSALAEGQPASAIRDLQRASILWPSWERQFSGMSSKQRRLVQLYNLNINLFTAYTLEGRIVEARNELQEAFKAASREGVSPPHGTDAAEPYLTKEIMNQIQDLLRQLPEVSAGVAREPSVYDNVHYALGNALYGANFTHAALAICKHIQSRWVYAVGGRIPTGAPSELCVAVLMLASEAETRMNRITDARKTLGTALSMIKAILTETPADAAMLEKQQECERRWRLIMMRY